ncbi:MAG: ATP synthase subunit I [Pseudomonadales bacterium]|jgi:ATP synthase protein I|nr:ATP synthase subunit I [Pseudomonadales bacterium]
MSVKQNSRSVSNLKAPPVYKVILAQLAITGFISVISLLFSGTTMALSVLLGGLISALPNSYFALHAFKYSGARNADKIVRGFIRGELGKIVMTVVFFALSFALISSLNELALILGFIATHFVGVMMSGLISSSPSSHKI